MGLSIKMPETDVTLEVCKMPDRERIALCLIKGNRLRPLAYFQKESYASDFERWLRDALQSAADNGVQWRDND